MQQTIQLGQVAQPSVLSQVKAAVESRTRSSLQQALAWWYAENRTLTALCGFEGDVFTHGDSVRIARVPATACRSIISS